MTLDPAAAPTDPARALVDVREVAIRYEGEDAFVPAGASFRVHRGEVVLLLGPSGSGKSTLTGALNGLIPHDIEAEVAGTVTVAGMDAATTPVSVLSRHVGMVFQDPDAQLVTGTVLDEVAFGPENLLVPAAEVLRRAEAALRRVGLWERRHDNPDALSGGGRQRLAIAAALAMGSGMSGSDVSGSSVLVLDEPTANLDPAGVDEVYAALAEVVASGDRAIVLVEHNLDLAVGLVDRVVVMDATGHTIADGPVDDILRTRAAELHALGVWLPTSALAALRLREAGYALDPLPLTPAELHAGLEKAPPVPAAAAPPKTEPSVTPPPIGPPAAPPAAPLITVRGLTMRRGRRVVLHDIELDIRPGEFIAVVGANGAGKTTLVQTLAGVIRPPRGSIRIGDTDITRLRPRQLTRQVGFVFQNPEHQFVAHTVHDELAYGLRHLPADEAEARVADLLARFGLTDRAATHPFLLSGGQKRRLSVGTALAAGAPVLVLDEPTFGQDRARADELLGLLAQLNAAGTTVIVVSHDMQVVTDYATRTIVLAGGRVLADAPTGEIFAAPTLLAQAGLRLPPLREALSGLHAHPELAGITRLADLPGHPADLPGRAASLLGRSTDLPGRTAKRPPHPADRSRHLADLSHGTLEERGGL